MSEQHSPIHPTQDHQRIESLDVADLRPEWVATLSRIPGAGLKGDYFPRGVLGVLMHTPGTLGSFLEWWVSCKSDMSLSVREQELVILRMGVLYRSDYVFRHHVPVGREFGVTDTELDAVRRGDWSGFEARERALGTLCDEMVEHRRVRDEVWVAHAGVLSDTDVVDLIGLVSQYVLFALANNVAQVQIEAPLADTEGIEGTRP